MHEDTQETALGYLRISDKKQIEGESPANQKRTIQKYADDNNIKVIEWFYDEAKSGKNTDRAELQNMLKLATKKKNYINYIIVYKMSRASRNLKSYMINIEAILEPRGIKIRSATETFDESPMGKFVKNLHIMTAELENDTKRETVIDNMSDLARQGWWLHRPPRGYDRLFVKNTDGKKRTTITPNYEASKIENTLLRWNRGDMTESQLVHYCTSIGLLGINGKPLTQDVLHKIIINPVYAGYVCCKLTDNKRVNGEHKGLISPDVFEQNQLILKMKNKDYLLGLKHEKTNELFPLRRFVCCVSCKQFMTASSPQNSPRYYCHRASCRKTGSIMATTLHDRFEELLKDITPTQGTTRLLREILKRQVKQELGNLNRDISRIRGALDANDTYRQQILNKYITDKITEADKKSATHAADTERLELHAELAELEHRQTVSENNIDHALNFMADISERWRSAPLELKQAYQELVFPNGFVYDIKDANFITPNISPLYRYVNNKKDLSEAEKSLLVISRRIELRLPG